MVRSDWQIVHLRLNRDLYDAIRRQAKDEERPLASVIRRVLRQYCEREQGHRKETQ